MVQQSTLVEDVSMREPALPAHALIPPGWRTVKLGEAFRFTVKPKGIKYSDVERVPFVPMEYVPIGRMYFDNYILKETSDVSSGTYFEPGDVLVAKITPSFENGKQGIIETLSAAFGIATTEVIPIKDIPGLSDKHFLFFYLLRPDVRANLAAKMEGTTGRQRLSISTLANWELELPPLPEQRAIARILRTVQDAIQARRREAELERERKAALMQRLFTHGTRGEPTKVTEIGEMPEGWQVVRMGDLCSAGRGVIQTGPFGSQLHASDYKDVGVPVVNPTHLGFNTIIETHLPRISKEDADMLNRHYLRVGDILIARRGDFSRYSYIGDAQVGWLCGTGCLLIRLFNRDVDNYFVSVSMSTAIVQNYMRQNAVGSIMPNLNTKILEGMPLALPPLEQQHEIADLLRACEAKVVALELETEHVEELFRALLEELMTGRLSALPLVETAVAAEIGAPA